VAAFPNVRGGFPDLGLSNLLVLMMCEGAVAEEMRPGFRVKKVLLGLSVHGAVLSAFGAHRTNVHSWEELVAQ
jgi:hypothetical protein